MNIIFSLCGKGSRFADCGFIIPKYLIAYYGAPMLYHSVTTLGLKGTVYFIVKSEHLLKYRYLEKFLLSLGDEIVVIDHDTEGAAQSILLSEKYIKDKTQPMVSANSDQYMDWNGQIFQKQLESDPESSYILTFRSNSLGCSYVRKNEHGDVVEVREKKVISNEATVGVYHWWTTEQFFRDAEEMIRSGIRDNNEYYVAPVYNITLKNNKKVKTFKIPDGQFHPVGTPNEYFTFLSNPKFIV